MAEAAILGLQIKRSELDAKIAELRLIAFTGESRSSSHVAGTSERRRSFSAASCKNGRGATQEMGGNQKNVTGTSAKQSGKAGTSTKKNKGTGKPAKKTDTKNLRQQMSEHAPAIGDLHFGVEQRLRAHFRHTAFSVRLDRPELRLLDQLRKATVLLV